MEKISELDQSSTIVSVTLHENPLTKDGTYYATVSRNKATFKNTLAEIEKANKGVDPYQLQFSAIQMQQQILTFLRQGKTVNVLDLGTLYPALKCSVKGKSDVPQTGSFCVKFTPSPLANKAVEDISVDKIVFADESPEITIITDIKTGVCDETLTAEQPCCIQGGNLKIGGVDSGIWFAPIEADGSYNKDETTWTKVEDSALFHNKPKELYFFVPSLSSGSKYKIILRTAYLGKDKTRKKLLQTESEIITIN